MLSGAEWQVELDYSPKIRQQTKLLLKIKKQISEVVGQSNTKIKVYGEEMKIKNNKFYLVNKILMFEDKPGYVKLNEIFPNCNFNANSFLDLDTNNQSQ